MCAGARGRGDVVWFAVDRANGRRANVDPCPSIVAYWRQRAGTRPIDFSEVNLLATAFIVQAARTTELGLTNPEVL